jgi:hypothetical protein
MCSLLCYCLVGKIDISVLTGPGLGVRSEVFLKSFDIFLEELTQLTTSDVIATKYLILKNEMTLANTLVQSSGYQFSDS